MPGWGCHWSLPLNGTNDLLKSAAGGASDIRLRFPVGIAMLRSPFCKGIHLAQSQINCAIKTNLQLEFIWISAPIQLRLWAAKRKPKLNLYTSGLELSAGPKRTLYYCRMSARSHRSLESLNLAITRTGRIYPSNCRLQQNAW
jgi:hypothetical protein